jgi:transcriptional regulator with XRE-family HTH domain
LIFSSELTISRVDYKKASGQRIEALRVRRGWSLKTLAEESGLFYKRIDHYEKGRRQIAPAEAVTLAKALGAKPAYLMALDDSEVQISPLEEALIRNWRTLSERERMEHFRKLETAAMQNRDPASPHKVDKAMGKAPKKSRKEPTL